MGFLDKFFGKGKRDNPKPAEEKGENAASPAERSAAKAVIDQMAFLAEQAMNDGNYARAAETYKKLLELEKNGTAQYNLGSLYAQGKGVERDFMEGAYWLHQAAMGGDEQAEKLCMKCALDYIHQDFGRKSPGQLFEDMVRYIQRVYPESVQVKLDACKKLYAAAGNHFNKKEYAQAAKLFRAAAEFGGDGYAQNYLAVLYNAGAGIEKNDLAALYWFDKATDNGAADAAKTDRDGILNAYRTNLSPADFYQQMLLLADWCAMGSADVPKDAAKAAYWRKIGEERVQAALDEKE